MNFRKVLEFRSFHPLSIRSVKLSTCVDASSLLSLPERLCWHFESLVYLLVGVSIIPITCGWTIFAIIGPTRGWDPATFVDAKWHPGRYCHVALRRLLDMSGWFSPIMINHVCDYSKLLNKGAWSRLRFDLVLLDLGSGILWLAINLQSTQRVRHTFSKILSQ